MQMVVDEAVDVEAVLQADEAAVEVAARMERERRHHEGERKRDERREADGRRELALPRHDGQPHRPGHERDHRQKPYPDRVGVVSSLHGPAPFVDQWLAAASTPRAVSAPRGSSRSTAYAAA